MVHEIGQPRLVEAAVEANAAVLAGVEAAAAAVAEAGEEGVQVGLNVHALAAQVAHRQGQNTCLD
jgi:hypothetical protein